MDADNSVRTCPAGSFKGRASGGCMEFRGIRYASSERYCPPVPYIYPGGIHECFEPAPFCLQDEARIEGLLLGAYYRDMPQTESCQFLSIAVPEGADEASKLPVMVWYHGGSFKNGGCEMYVYNRKLLSSEQDVIVVGVNYRLGVLGFLRDKDGNLSHNGLLDAIEGLRWVKENISGFGGDPDNITVFGQSAGAEIVRSLLVAEGTDDLFRRAIIQSAPIGTMKDRTSMEQSMLEELNTYPADMSSEELLAAQNEIYLHVTEKGPPKEMRFAPHYGTYPLPKEEDVPAIMKERAPRHPILIGYNTREVMAYVGGEEKLRRQYRIPFLKILIKKAVMRSSKSIFIEPTKEFASSYAASGGDTYLYRFHWMERSFLGSCHGSELPLLFGTEGFKEGSEILMGLSKSKIEDDGAPLRSIWAGFARDGSMDTLHVEDTLDIEHIRGE